MTTNFDMYQYLGVTPRHENLFFLSQGLFYTYGSTIPLGTYFYR